MRERILALLLMFTACKQPGQPPRPEPAPLPVTTTRNAAGAGQTYPADPGSIRDAVRERLSKTQRNSTVPVRMVVVPLGPWQQTAASLAATFRELDNTFTRVVFVTPRAKGPDFHGISLDRTARFTMPGAEYATSTALLTQLKALPLITDVADAHNHPGPELILPFLEGVKTRPFEIVSLVVGTITADQARSFARQLSTFLNELTVVVFAVRTGLPGACINAVGRMNAFDVTSCSGTEAPLLLAAMEAAAQKAWSPRMINTADIASVVFEDRFELGEAEQSALLALAREAVEKQVKQGQPPQLPANLTAQHPRLATPRGTFVTLKKHGELRGCIGSLSAFYPLAEDIIRNAVNAAIHDPRFPPVKPDELKDVVVSVSVLETPRQVQGLAGEALLKWLGETKPGLIIHYNGRRSTFLPEVWEELPTPVMFLGHLCRKQGSPAECWQFPETRFEAYGSLHFAEKQAH